MKKVDIQNPFYEQYINIIITGTITIIRFTFPSPPTYKNNI
jgi:hypothetical protein